MKANTAQISSVSNAQVIQFPKAYRYNEGALGCPIEVMGNVIEMKVAAAEEALAFIMENTFRDVVSAGFTAPDERKNALLVALTRAIMYEHLGLLHPLHNFVEQHADQIDEILENQLDLLLPEDLLDEDDD